FQIGYRSRNVTFCDVENTNYVKIQNNKFYENREGSGINATILVEKTLQKLTANVTVRQCGEQRGHTCNTKLELSRDVCSDLEATDAPNYSQTFRESVSPKITCPIKPGEYQIEDLSLSMSNNSSLVEFYRADGVYETHIIFQEDNIPILCVTIIGYTYNE
ncbi:Uncharacterized protein GBIM_02876, partial [Gryllus bimaculatus]